MSKSPTSTNEKPQSSEPPKKKLRKKLPAQRTASATSTATTPGILVDRIEVVPIDSIRPYPGNPRRGNVPALAESLRRNGQYRALVVQKSTRYILGGNHTWQGAKAGNWPEIAVTFIDVSDEQAARIVLVDNRSSDLAGYDPELLADILGAIPDPNIGTGYSSEDIAAITRAVASTEPMDLSSILHPINAVVKETDEDRKPTRTFDMDDEPTDEEMAQAYKEIEEDAFGEAPEDTDGSAFDLKDDVTFSSTTPWGIPDLRLDMMVDVLPDPLDTWAGTASKEKAETYEGYWLYNYGIDSTSGMKDASRIILAFYAWDEWFLNWWFHPARMMTKTLNAGIEYAITPNFSQISSMPAVVNMWSVFRSRWLGRYFQEIGVKVIPDVDWILGDRKWLDEIVLPGIPVGTPIISIQVQNYEKESGSRDPAKQITQDVEHIVDVLQPETVFVYAGKPGKALLDTWNLPCEVHYQANRLIDLGQYRAKLKKNKEESGERVRIK